MNVGAFIAAALLLDIVLWRFVLFGWEGINNQSGVGVADAGFSLVPLAVAAVPEPETWATRATGLLLLGVGCRFCRDAGRIPGQVNEARRCRSGPGRQRAALGAGGGLLARSPL